MTLTPLLPVMYEPLVRTALLEDLGRAGDITADAIVPADKQSSLVLRARQQGVVAGLDIARCAFQLVKPRHPARRRAARRQRGGARRSDRDHRGAGARSVDRRTDGAELSLPSQRRRDRDGLAGISGARHQGAHRLHPQDHAWITCAGKIRGPRRRRQQSPLRPRRRHSDQGQPHRACRRCQHRDRARESACRPSRQDRDRGRYAFAARTGPRDWRGCRPARQYDGRSSCGTRSP